MSTPASITTPQQQPAKESGAPQPLKSATPLQQPAQESGGPQPLRVAPHTPAGLIAVPQPCRNRVRNTTWGMQQHMQACH